MGKVPTATAMTEMKRKKKGRPSKNPLPLSTPPKTSASNSTSRRSTRRNPNQFNSPPEAEFDDDDDDERKEKKVKLVVRLPQSDDKSKVAENQQQSRRHSNDSDSDSESASGSGSDPEDEDREEPAKKRKISGVELGSDDGGLDQDKEVVEATETPLHGSPLESGPTTLPDKKWLVFILDRLQKKDTYGVFSEPVDPEELPDYFDIIKQPMDFGTVRKKLEKGSYRNLDELEADVNLICSNAMEYNASDTVYYRQARAIQELAKRDFKNLKHEGDDGEPQPKVLRRGRPPSNKNQKKSSEAYKVVDHVGTERSSGATLASGEDKANGSNLYNLRKASSALFRSRSTDPFVSSYGSRNGENYSELSTDWNEEFPASILRADMKYGKKQFTVDENKRDTYRESGNNLYNSVGNMKLLVPVGLQVQEALAYARSLARYAANLGPVAWKMASKKIETAIPAGVQYGPGWVGDNGPLSQPLPVPIEKQKQPYSTAGDSSSSKLTPPSTSDLTSVVRKLNSQNELPGQGDAPWRTPFPPQQNHPHRNGVNRMFGYDLSAVPAPPPPQKAETGHSNDSQAFVKSQQRHALSVPPDLNVRVLGGSPGPSLPIGSPQQPDLALQL